MKRSQIAVLSALGAVAVGMILFTSVIRMALSQSDALEAEPPQSRQLGEQTRRSFDLSGFDSLEVGGNWTVSVTQGADWSVELSYPEGIEQDLDVRVRGGRLIIDYDPPGFWFLRVRGPELGADIVMPELAGVHLAGASELDLAGFDGEQLEISASGAAEMRGRDTRYDRLSLSVSGAAEVDFRDVLVTDARISLSGASDVRLGMNGGVLSGNISGAGSITYYGTIREQNVSISGAASIEKADY